MNVNDVVNEYVNGKSPQEIAEKYGTYSNKIRRILKKHVQLRSRSDANKQALDSGRKEHPTKGKTLSTEHKVKLSEASAKNWRELSDEKRTEYSDKCRERWNNMSEDDRKKMQELAHEAVRLSAKDGSKLERFVVEGLRSEKIVVVTHKTGLIVNDNLEVDIFLPDYAVVIEIDGPSHFFPIWGADKLAKQIKADTQKAGLLLNAGFVMIRIKCVSSYISEKIKRDIIFSLLDVLNKVKKNRPTDPIDRFIEIEV